MEFIRQNEKEGNYELYGFINDQSPRMRPRLYWREFLGVKVPVFKALKILLKSSTFPVYLPKSIVKEEATIQQQFLYNGKSLRL